MSCQPARRQGVCQYAQRSHRRMQTHPNGMLASRQRMAMLRSKPSDISGRQTGGRYSRGYLARRPARRHDKVQIAGIRTCSRCGSSGHASMDARHNRRRKSRQSTCCCTRRGCRHPPAEQRHSRTAQSHSKRIQSRRRRHRAVQRARAVNHRKAYSQMTGRQRQPSVC